MKLLFRLCFLLSLTSCLEYQDITKKDIPPACPQIASQSSSILPEPTILPNLNINPIYLEIRTAWHKELEVNKITNYSMFRLFNTSSGIKAEIQISNTQSYHCSKDLNQNDLTNLNNLINTSKMCKAEPYPQNSCTLSMIAPASLYAIDSNNGPITVNLYLHGLESDTSFCNNDDVNAIEEYISDLFANVNLEQYCKEVVY